MTNVMVFERKTSPMKRPEQEEVSQILERIEKLSIRPQNPGLAYQNLESIHALTNTLREKLVDSPKEKIAH